MNTHRVHLAATGATLVEKLLGLGDGELQAVERGWSPSASATCHRGDAPVVHLIEQGFEVPDRLQEGVAIGPL